MSISVGWSIQLLRIPLLPRASLVDQLQISAMSVQRAQKKALEALRQQLGA
ncbi:MAG: hypothetical protein NWR59_03610 [Cyanobium sp. MAG_185]|nr:hypothetical protein [Cyanobium sp. MAG_185]